MKALDGLRGLAALIVVFSHGSLAGFDVLPGLDLAGIGKSGVYLFFLLSAFLLSLQLLHQPAPVLSWSVMSHYWRRRVLRIYPLYTLYLLCAVVSTWLTPRVAGQAATVLPFPLDWTGLFAQLALLEGRGVTWSIAVEFKFYFLLPLLIWAVVSCRRGGTGAMLGLLAVCLVLARWWFSPSESAPNDARLWSYLPIFLVGSMLAVIQSSVPPTGLNPRQELALNCLGLTSVAALVLLTPQVFSVLIKPVATDFAHQAFLLHALLWAAVLMASINTRGFIKALLTTRLLRFFGAISFSLYLFHPIAIAAVASFHWNSLLSAWMVLILSSSAAYFSFRYFESPISRLTWSARRQTG